MDDLDDQCESEAFTEMVGAPDAAVSAAVAAERLIKRWEAEDKGDGPFAWH